MQKLRADFYEEMVAFGKEVYGIDLKKLPSNPWQHEIKTVLLLRPKKNVLLKSETGTRGREGLPGPYPLFRSIDVNPIYD